MITVIKRLNCGTCMELRRIKIKDDVEPPCPVCGSTSWLALPNIDPPPPRREDAWITAIAQLFDIPIEWIIDESP